MKKALLALATSAALVGCGGGGSGSGASSQDTTYKKDGIYVNNTDLVVMLVDSDLPLGSVLIGDYVNNEFLVNDTHSISGNTLTTKGLSYVSPALTTYSADVEAKFTFSEMGATANGVLNGTNLIYSFDRAPDSVALADMLGTHTNPVDGSTWTIEQDGTFTINGICTISGKLTRVDSYYSATNVSASNCTDAGFNGNGYGARLLTVTKGGTTYILGIMANNDHFIWGSAPL
ncbi:hypothetical protein NK428_002115 [Vibrio navarrensis]|nr:hypothetical protein [Vibrio navarrensis]